MNQHKQSSDLDLGRGWLNRAAEMLDGCEDHVSDAEFAHAAAIIGNGFIALAHAERAAASMAESSQMRQAILTMSDEPETTLVEAVERERRAAAEARPHDDEPKPPRCTGCFGPFSDGTHGPGCTQRCQDCFGAPDGPGACRCRDGCTCEHPPAAGGLHRPNCPAYVAPSGEAAYLLEGDDEIFTAPPPVIVHVVAEDDGNVLHVASTAGKAEQWLMSTAGNREARDALSITELAVDRG